LKSKDKYFECDIKMYKTQIKQLEKSVFKFTDMIKTQTTKLDAVTSQNEKLTHEVRN
jgi:prefoldin subunit 5